MNVSFRSDTLAPELRQCPNTECPGLAKNARFPNHFAFCPNCGECVLENSFSRLACKLWWNFLLFSFAFALLIVEPVWPAYFLALYIYLHALFFTTHSQNWQRRVLVLFTVAAIIGTSFGVAAPRTWELWIAITALGTTTVVITGMTPQHASRMFLSVTAIFAAYLQTELFFLEHGGSGLLHVLDTQFKSRGTTFDWNRVAALEHWWILRLFLLLAATVAVKNKYSAIRERKIGRIIPVPSPFHPLRPIGWNPEQYIASVKIPFVRTIVSVFVLFAYHAAGATLVVFNRIKRAGYLFKVEALKVIDIAVRIFLRVLTTVFLLALGMTGAILLAIVDVVRAVSVCIVSVVFPLALSMAFVTSILGLSWSISHILGTGEYTYAVRSLGSTFLCVIALLAFGRWAISPTATRRAWWRTTFPEPVPIGVFSKPSGQNLRSGASSLGNYLQLATPEFFLCFFGNLVVFDFLGRFGHIGPYRFGVPFAVCSAILVVGGVFVLSLKRLDQSTQ